MKAINKLNVNNQLLNAENGIENGLEYLGKHTNQQNWNIKYENDDSHLCNMMKNNNVEIYDENIINQSDTESIGF